MQRSCGIGLVWIIVGLVVASTGCSGSGDAEATSDRAVERATAQESEDWETSDGSRDEDGSSFPAGGFPMLSTVNELNATDAASGDAFGRSIAIQGETAVVGAPSDDHDGKSDVGAVYVFGKGGDVWLQRHKLTPSDGAAGDAFGSSVAIDGDTIVVGARLASPDEVSSAGAAYVYTLEGSEWSEQQKLIASDAAESDMFGRSVDIIGETVVVGAYEHDPAGAVYVYVRSGGSWSEQARLTPSDADEGDGFGSSVAIDGATIAAGSQFDKVGDKREAGSAYVFVRRAGAWSEQAKLTPSDVEAGQRFGNSVALDRGTAVVGSSVANHGGMERAGSAYVYVRSGGGWSEQTKLVAKDAAADDEFGVAVDLYADMLAVGAWEDVSDPNAAGGDDGQGAAYAPMPRRAIATAGVSPSRVRRYSSGPRVGPTTERMRRVRDSPTTFRSISMRTGSTTGRTTVRGPPTPGRGTGTRTGSATRAMSVPTRRTRPRRMSTGTGRATCATIVAARLARRATTAAVFRHATRRRIARRTASASRGPVGRRVVPRRTARPASRATGGGVTRSARPTGTVEPASGVSGTPVGRPIARMSPAVIARRATEEPATRSVRPTGTVGMANSASTRRVGRSTVPTSRVRETKVAIGPVAIRNVSPLATAATAGCASRTPVYRRSGWTPPWPIRPQR